MPDRGTIRTHAAAVALVFWTLLIWVQAVPGAFDRFGTLRGVDFLHFYAFGRLVVTGQQGSLYDWERFATVVGDAVPGAGVLFFPIYPPQTALLFAPFGAMAFFWALGSWVLVSAGLYGLAAWLIWRFTPSLRPYGAEVAMLAIAYPPFLQLLAHGQTAAPALLLLVSAWCLLRNGRPFWTGVALGGLFFKLQFSLFPALALLVLRPRGWISAGIVAAAAVQAAAIVALLDVSLIPDYLDSLLRAASLADLFEPRPWMMHSLNASVLLILGRSRLALSVTVLASAVVLWIVWRTLRRVESDELRFAVMCLAALVLNPHLYGYDLVLLGLPLALVASTLIAREGDRQLADVAWVAYSLTWVSLLAPLAQVTRLQLTAPAMLALIWLLYRAAPVPSIGRPRSAPATHPA